VRDKEQEKLYHRTDEPKVPAQSSDKDWQALLRGVPGLNVEKGIARFNGDKDAYLDVLRSYAKNTLPLIDATKLVDKDDLKSYTTIVHGIKGSSSGICAEEVADIAEALENAGSIGDYGYISAHNEDLSEATRKLISDIFVLLEEVNADNMKPKRERPDAEVLEMLREACVNFEMDDVDKALARLESFEYESGGELVAWLREHAEQTNFNEIIERLTSSADD